MISPPQSLLNNEQALHTKFLHIIDDTAVDSCRFSELNQ